MAKTKKVQDLEDAVRSRPGASARIDAHTEAMRTVLRLQRLREEFDTTQTELAELMATTQENVSRIERTQNPYLGTISHYVAALGGHIEINAVFDDRVIPLGTVGDTEPTPA